MCIGDGNLNSFCAFEADIDLIEFLFSRVALRCSSVPGSGMAARTLTRSKRISSTLLIIYEGRESALLTVKIFGIINGNDT